MKRDDDDFINEDSINDLINYAEDDDKEADGFEDYIEEAEDFDDEVSEEYTEEDDDTEETEEFIEEIVEKPKNRNEEAVDVPDIDYYDDLYLQNKKNTRIGVILGVIIGIIAVALFITVDSGIIGRYKHNFSNNYARIFRNFIDDGSEQVIETPKPVKKKEKAAHKNTVITFEGASESEFAPYRDGIICANTNYLAFIDDTGKIVWEIDTAIVEPILKTAGNYILLAEDGRNKLCLYADRKLIYDVDDTDNIMNANVSEDGDVVLVTDKSTYKGGISVYNKSGKQIYSWASGADTVMCADISSSSRRVAVSLLNTEATAKSRIELFDVNKTESYSSIEVEDTVIFDVEFTGNILNAFGDNRILGIGENGKLVYDNTFVDVQLTHSAMDSKGNKLMSIDDGNVPIINMYTKRGGLKETLTLTGVADNIDINGSNILYNIGRDIYFGRINSKSPVKYTAAMDIRDLLIMTDNTFVIVYSNSVEVVTV